MPPKIIFIGGAQATGKTSTIAAVVRRLNKKFTGAAEHIEGGEALRKAAGEKFGLPLNSISAAQLEQIRAELYDKVRKSTARIVLFVDHYAYTPQGSEVQEEVITPNKPLRQKLLPHIQHFVLLEDSPEEVHRRRAASGKERLREYSDVTRGLMGQRIVARAVSRETRIPLAIVLNKFGKQDHTVRRIERIATRHLMNS